MGDYFARTSILWAQLTEHLIKGPHITQASIKAHERCRTESHMSDFAELARIDVNISKLSIKFSRDVQETWQPECAMMDRDSILLQTPISPFYDDRMSSSSLVESRPLASVTDPSLPLSQFAPRKLLPDKGQIHIDHGRGHVSADISGSDDSSDGDEKFQDIDMDALRQRGKGIYYCPKGLKCDKGGVDKDALAVRLAWMSKPSEKEEICTPRWVGEA
ncbi:hypothetical protein UVI_02027770 [Ustilaginoidea virens]|uniref:Uncharacterized protein n=1 Tax=Ustilaginoidea virens TaxID=1159556 RepID=A0A1B5KVG4_USTVR|nr:hypothetical protein UVI_02027770 [Ustilaginoidea virens]